MDAAVHWEVASLLHIRREQSHDDSRYISVELRKSRNVDLDIEYQSDICLFYPRTSVQYEEIIFMTRELFFSILAFLILSVNTVVYWKGIIRKEIIPHPFTMFIWVIVLSITAIELVHRNEFLGAVPSIFLTIAIFCELLVGIYLWKKIVINWMDYFFLIAGILLIAYWQYEPEYRYVLLVMIGIDACAYAASFKKAWLQPNTENSLPYFISVGNNICTIFALYVWSFENMGMAAWTAGVNCTFACFILARQYSMRK